VLAPAIGTANLCCSMSRSPLRILLESGLCAVLLTTGLGCHGARDTPPAGRPNVLLVTIDTLRADHTSAYGYAIPTTPNLELLASQGLRFAHMYAASSTTGPSHASLFSGRPQRSVGYMKNGHVLNGDVTTLAEILTEAGYETAAFVSSGPVHASFGFAQGFQTFDAEPGATTRRKKNGTIPKARRGDETAKAVVRWLAKRGDSRPLFVWVHLFDPHAPYNPPKPFRGEWAKGTSTTVRGYDSEVHFADEQLGKIVRAFEKATGPAGAIVAVTADHGEGLGDHDWRGHGVNLHEEAVRIPLVLTWKGHLPAGEVVDAPATHMDVAPTILDLVGIRPPADYEGIVLTADAPADRPIFVQRREYRSKRDKGKRVRGDMIAVMQGRWKYIRAPDEGLFELYDTREDPHEQTNVVDRYPDQHQRLDRMIDEWVAGHPPPNYVQPELSDEDRRALRALGYVD